jgi:biotin transport system substrate-specific component
MAEARVRAGSAKLLEQHGDVRVRQLAAVIFVALLTALGSYMRVPLPGTEVPVTMQTLIVSLAGALLGARLGAMSQALYLAAGALGAPVFAGGAAGLPWLFGPTGGYLLAFPLAAAVTGILVKRAADDGSLAGALRLGVAILLGTAVVFVGGASQLALLTGDPARAVQLGVLPFIAGDLLKVVAAVLVTRRLGARARALL